MNNKIINLLGLATRARNIVSGDNAVENALKLNKVKMLIISEEASDKTKKNYKFYANKYNIPIIFMGKIDELSNAIGEKNRAIIGIKDINIVKGIEKIIDGGEAIG